MRWRRLRNFMTSKLKKQHQERLAQSKVDRGQLEARLKALDTSLEVQSRGRFRNQ